MKELFVARQPIFDSQQNVWGYELLYRLAPEDEVAVITDEDDCTLKVASSLSVSPDYSFQEAKCVINATRDFIVNGHALGLASDRLILSADLATFQDPEIMDALAELKRNEVQLALTLDGCTTNQERLFQDIDLIELPWPLFGSQAQEQWVKKRKSLLLVSRIETHEQAAMALQAGADLLQGFYFQRPKTYSVKSLCASLVNRLKILQILESEDPDIQDLTLAIEADVGITHRLLTFVNSAAFSLVRRLDSVRHAISLVGWKRLKNWLHLIVICDTIPAGQTQEIAHTCTVRAKFLELLALYSGRREKADKLYLLGLFSLLDTLLQRPFQKIFNELRLHEDIEAALLYSSGPLHPWLQLIHVLESGDWRLLDARAKDLGVSVPTISKSKLEAMQWARNFFYFVG